MSYYPPKLSLYTFRQLIVASIGLSLTTVLINAIQIKSSDINYSINNNIATGSVFENNNAELFSINERLNDTERSLQKIETVLTSSTVVTSTTRPGNSNPAISNVLEVQNQIVTGQMLQMIKLLLQTIRQNCRDWKGQIDRQSQREESELQALLDNAYRFDNNNHNDNIDLKLNNVLITTESDSYQTYQTVKSNALDKLLVIERNLSNQFQILERLEMNSTSTNSNRSESDNHNDYHSVPAVAESKAAAPRPTEISVNERVQRETETVVSGGSSSGNTNSKLRDLNSIRIVDNDTGKPVSDPARYKPNSKPSTTRKTVIVAKDKDYHSTASSDSSSSTRTVPNSSRSTISTKSSSPASNSSPPSPLSPTSSSSSSSSPEQILRCPKLIKKPNADESIRQLDNSEFINQLDRILQAIESEHEDNVILVVDESIDKKPRAVDSHLLVAWSTHLDFMNPDKDFGGKKYPDRLSRKGLLERMDRIEEKLNLGK